MTRGRIFVTFGVVLLILALLAGIGVAIYYLVQYFKSPIVINYMYVSKPQGGIYGLNTNYLNILFYKTGECIDCNPVLNFVKIYQKGQSQYGTPLAVGSSFSTIELVDTKMWKASILLSDAEGLDKYNGLLDVHISLKVSASTLDIVQTVA